MTWGNAAACARGRFGGNATPSSRWPSSTSSPLAEGLPAIVDGHGGAHYVNPAPPDTCLPVDDARYRGAGAQRMRLLNYLAEHFQGLGCRFPPTKVRRPLKTKPL